MSRPIHPAPAAGQRRWGGRAGFVIRRGMLAGRATVVPVPDRWLTLPKSASVPRHSAVIGVTMSCETARRKLAAAVNPSQRVILPAPDCRDSSPLRQGMLRICAWCQRVPVGLNFWVQIDQAEQLLPFLSLAMIEEATHGVCPDCYHEFLYGKQTAVL